MNIKSNYQFISKEGLGGLDYHLGGKGEKSWSHKCAEELEEAIRRPVFMLPATRFEYTFLGDAKHPGRGQHAREQVPRRRRQQQQRLQVFTPRKLSP